MTQAQINAERLANIKALSAGAHPKNGDEMCVMEAVAYVAGEPWSYRPVCACPVLTTFMVSWNDGLPDDDRTRLLAPFIPKLVNTKGSKALESRRSTMAADWLVRTYAPAWLRLAGLTAQADALASFPEITDFAKTPSIKPVLEAARADACAARDAACDAAWAAARATTAISLAGAGSAAWVASGAAARAAGAAAWGAAWAAGTAAGAAWTAGTAAGAAWTVGTAAGAAQDAAGDTRDALKPTVESLQASALELVERMIAEGETT